MKHKISSVIIFLAVAFIGVAYGGNDVNDDVRASVHEFIDSLYKCAKGDIACDIEEYKLEESAKKFISYMISINRIDRIEGIEFTETRILANEPLVVKVFVKELYRPEEYRPPYHEFRYILEDTGNFNWKVVEITEPGL